MRRKSFEDMDCSLASALETLGDVWSVLILRDLMFGLRRFDDLQNTLGIASDTLAARLKSLEAVGLIQRRPYSERPLRHEYWLTPKGLDLRTSLMALADWGERWSGRAEGDRKMDYVHHLSGRRVEIGPYDAETGTLVPASEVRIRLGAGAGDAARRRVALAQRRAAERKLASGG